jgi:hypothetical protein
LRPQISSTTIPKTRARFAWQSTRCSAPLWWHRAGRRAGSGGACRPGEGRARGRRARTSRSGGGWGRERRREEKV